MKKKILAFMLACIMCFSSTVAMAATSYQWDKKYAFGGTVVGKGEITSITAFVASTKLEGATQNTTNAEVKVKVNVYTIPPENGYVYVGRAESTGNTSCSVNQTATTLPPAGTYSIRKIEGTHQISNNVTVLFTGTLTAEY